MAKGSRAALLVEFVLCVAMAMALSYVVQGGFNVSETLRSSFILGAVVCLVLQGILFVGRDGGRRRIIAYVIFAVASIGGCVVAVLVSQGKNPVADIPANFLVLTVIFVLCNLLVYALSRRQLTCVILFVVGAFVCGLIQFLYTMNALVATVVFVFAALVMVGFKSYVGTAKQVVADRMPFLGRAVATSALIPLVACVMAGVVVIGIIMPLNPPHATIKLLNEYVSYEEQKVKTAVELDQTAERTVTSSNVDETLPERTTSDKKIDSNAKTEIDSNGSTSNGSKNYLSSDYSDVDLDSLLGGAKSIALNKAIPWKWILLGILVFLILTFTLPRYIIHTVRLRRICSKPPRQQVVAYYRFFLGRFKKLGFGKPDALTPAEYANLFRGRLNPYVGAQESATFDHLTALYIWQQYGASEPTQDDLICLRWLYKSFYTNCRKNLGLLKYAFKYIAL